MTDKLTARRLKEEYERFRRDNGGDEPAYASVLLSAGDHDAGPAIIKFRGPVRSDEDGAALLTADGLDGLLAYTGQGATLRIRELLAFDTEKD